MKSARHISAIPARQRLTTLCHSAMLCFKNQFNSVSFQQLLLRTNLNMFLIVAFGLLQIADGAITYFGLSFSAVDEVNPLLNICAEYLGLGMSITVVKLIIIMGIMFLFCARHQMKSRWNTATLASAVSFYSWVVSSNVNLVMNG